MGVPRALSSSHPCARSPGLLDGNGHLRAAAAAPVAAAFAAPTVRALGQGLRAEEPALGTCASVSGALGPWWGSPRRERG